MYDFHKIFFFQKELFVENKYLNPFSKKLILLKKIHSVKKIHSEKHSVKHEFHFQFSFATNNKLTGLNDSKKI